MLYLCFLMETYKETLSLLYKPFPQPLLTYASPKWLPLLSTTNITTWECFHRAASHAIYRYFSFSPISLLLYLPYKSPSFHISGLARLGAKPRFCRFSWRAFAFTHLLMLLFTSPREALFACPPSPPWNLPSFTVESLFSPF